MNDEVFYENSIRNYTGDNRRIIITDVEDNEAIVLTCDREQHPHDSLPHRQIVDGYFFTWERL